MPKRLITVTGLLLAGAALAACSSKPPIVIAPDTQPGDQIKDEYMAGDWCTNREETAKVNQEAGHSGLLNVEPVFWRFELDGVWRDSTSGFYYDVAGSWKIEGLDTLTVTRKSGKATSRQARFQNDGADLYLIDEEDKVKVLKRCE